MYTPGMRRSASVLLLAVATVAMLATSASAALYSINITQPSSSTVAGNVTVYVSVSGVTKPSSAAYEMNSGSWSESSKHSLTKLSNGNFQATFDSGGYANGSYKILVRAWNNGVMTYNPNDSSTYASDSVSVKVNNAPPAPSSVTASGGKGTASASWYAISTADRSDFAGYRVYRASSPDGTCPSFDTYQYLETTFSTAHSDSGMSAGTYCYVVTSTRSSPVSGTIESSPSSSASADVQASGSPSPSPSPSSGGGGGSPSPSGSPPPGWHPTGNLIQFGRGPGAHAPSRRRPEAPGP